MDHSEELAHQYLLHQGYRAIVYEPDGKVPPDFLVNGSIAVEVRRLNQNEEGAARPTGLEEVAQPLRTTVLKALASFGPPTTGHSWFVTFTFRRPLPPWRELKRQLMAALRRFQDSPADVPDPIRIGQAVALRFDKASVAHPTFFVLGASADHDGGGFLVSEMARNLDLCIAQKAKKIASVRHRYREWWLLLEDRISHGILDDSERQDLRRLVCARDPFSKVVLFSPLNPTRAFDL